MQGCRVAAGRALVAAHGGQRLVAHRAVGKNAAWAPPAALSRHSRSSALTHRRALATASAAADAASSGAASGSSSYTPPPAGFSSLERLLSDRMGGGFPGGDWREVEGCWVLYPPAEQGPPRCLVHAIGGAFVGAAPQIAYRPLLEALAARGALIIANPYGTSFDHLRAADELHFKFERCLKSLGPSAIALKRFGLGHSLGALMHLLIGSRYPITSSGNVLLSFNNRPATDSIPLLSPFIAPSVRALGPLLSQLATSPLRSGVVQWIDMLKGVSPSIVRQLTPVLEQLTPIYLDVATGTQEFRPPPEETRNVIRQGYTVPRNLLVRFAADTIDETPQLASTLQSSAVSGMLELTVKTLPGDHVRPLTQDLNRVSPDLARAATQAAAQGESLLGQLGQLAQSAGLPQQAAAQLSDLARLGVGVTTALAQSVGAGDAAESIEALADEVGAFCGLRSNREPAALPAARPLPPPVARAGE